MTAPNKTFTYTQDSLAVGATDVYDFISGSATVVQKDVDNYSPFAKLVIYNNGNSDLRLYLNAKSPNSWRILPAGVILEVSDIAPISIVYVENPSTASTTGSYQLSVNNDRSEISVLEEIKEVLKNGS